MRRNARRQHWADRQYPSSQSRKGSARLASGIRLRSARGETARRDYLALTEAAALFSGHIWDVPQQVKKSQEEIKTEGKAREHLLAELAELEASRLLAESTSQGQHKVVVRSYADRDLTFIRLLAQKITRLDPTAIALLGAALGQASLVFAQSKGTPFDLGRVLKEIVAANGGKGGGSRDMAQGGLPKAELIENALAQAAAKVEFLRPTRCRKAHPPEPSKRPLSRPASRCLRATVP